MQLYGSVLCFVVHLREKLGKLIPWTKIRKEEIVVCIFHNNSSVSLTSFITLKYNIYEENLCNSALHQ